MRLDLGLSRVTTSESLLAQVDLREREKFLLVTSVAVCTLALYCYYRKRIFSGRLLSIFGVGVGVVAYITSFERDSSEVINPTYNGPRRASCPALFVSLDRDQVFQWNPLLLPAPRQSSSYTLPPLRKALTPKEGGEPVSTPGFTQCPDSVVADPKFDSLKVVPLVEDPTFAPRSGWKGFLRGFIPDFQVHNYCFIRNYQLHSRGKNDHRLPLRPGEGIFSNEVKSIHLCIDVLGSFITRGVKLSNLGDGFIYLDTHDEILTAQEHLRGRPNEGRDLLFIDNINLWSLYCDNSGLLRGISLSSLRIYGDFIGSRHLYLLPEDMLCLWFQFLLPNVKEDLIFEGINEHFKSMVLDAMESFEEWFLVESISEPNALRYKKRG